MRIRWLELPLANPHADTRFALVADRIGGYGEDSIDALRVFADQVGACGVLIGDEIELTPEPAYYVGARRRGGGLMARLRAMAQPPQRHPEPARPAITEERFPVPAPGPAGPDDDTIPGFRAPGSDPNNY
ncbi:MAG: hypothetical protein ABWY93_18805 [Mycobacterium sp.]